MIQSCRASRYLKPKPKMKDYAKRLRVSDKWEIESAKYPAKLTINYYQGLEDASILSPQYAKQDTAK
jgi:hypothetical protein